MNLTFNEISFQPYVGNGHVLKSKFLNLVKTYKELKTNYGFNHLVFPSAIANFKVLSHQNTYEWLSSLNGKDKEDILIYIKKPFSNDVLDGQMEDLDAYYFENIILGIKSTNCIGLGLAHLQNTATISLDSDNFWHSDSIEIIRVYEENNDLASECHHVRNVVLSSNLSTEFKEFAESILKIEMVETSLSPEEKPIRFRDDHGQDVLMAFAKRIRKSPYITQIINSIQFNRQTVRFIRRIFEDGKIEIVLHWEDDGYGMVIQTTGRNYRETEAIAVLLKNEYDK